MNQLVVLIPVYGNQEGLERTLQSLRMTRGNFDVVVVDDGSPTRILAPSQLRDHVPVVLLRLGQNRGIAGALNHGLGYILKREHEYVGRVDSGDTVVNDRFEQQVDFLNAHPKCGAIASFIDFVDADQKQLFQYRAPCENSEILRSLRLNNCMIHSGSVIRARALRECGIYRENILGVEDLDLFLRIAKRFELAVLPAALTRCEYSLKGLSIAGRRRQQRERLKLQVRHFDPASLHCFLGIARTLLAMMTPQAAVYRFKRAHML
jgi:glycosyltransferase involved in cell wall biosynthesis